MNQPAQKLVVIGASAGGVQALLDVLSALPATFEPAVLVVVHIGSGRSLLPELLTRRSNLVARHAEDGEPIVAGRVYVAPPDQHLLVRDGALELSRGPRENHRRPADDPLFRSAARWHGPNVIGVVLSGALNDGTSGLLMIKSRGGTAIVQDPRDAIVEGMPTSALRLVQADYVLPASEIGQVLATGAVTAPASQEVAMRDVPPDRAEQIIHRDFDAQEHDRRAGQLTMFTCPDCGGTLWQTDSGPLLRFHCHVGHGWGPEALLDQKSEELEAALWSSVRLLEERATLSRQVAARLRHTGSATNRAARVEEEARLDEQRAGVIRDVLTSPLGAAAGIASHNGDEEL